MSLKRTTILLALAALLRIAAPADAAFMIETRSGGKGFANFGYGGDTTSSSTTTTGTAAVGTTAGIGSVFGGNASAKDIYVFKYTPGADADNATYATGAILGSTTGFPGQGNVATGLAGGASGIYNVYFTVPESTNVANPSSDFTITQNGPSTVLTGVNLNNGGTGPDTDPGSAFVGGANNAWFKLATVTLNAGTQYTVTQQAYGTTFVSQRAAAVMFEFVGPAVPEPATFGLAAMGIIGLVLARRR